MPGVYVKQMRNRPVEGRWKCVTKEQLGTLIIASEKQMYATAKSILKEDNDCADAIQEAIVKAFGKVDGLKQDKYARTWLMRILTNECYNILRRGSRQVSLENCPEAAAMAAPERKDYGSLYEALRRLKEELRIVTTLYYVEEFSVREIAAILEISEGAVQKRLARAREKLKNMLKHMEVEW